MTPSSHQMSNGTLPAVVSGSTEVVPKARRRTFSAAYKQRILQEAEGCDQVCQIGALLRRIVG